MSTLKKTETQPEVSDPAVEFRKLLAISLEEIEFPKVLEIISARAVTTLGRDLILSSQPTDDIQNLQHEHSCIDDMLRLVLSGEDFPLEHTEDITMLLQKSMVSGAHLMASQILEVNDVIQCSRRVRSFLTARTNDAPFLSQLCERVYENRLLEKHINEAIDRSGIVRDNATKELQSIRHEIFQTSARLRSRLNKIVSKLGEEELLQDEYITQRDGRFVIPLKTNNKRALPGIIHGVSQSGSTVFMEPAEVFEMNNELSLLHNDEQREIVRILTMLTAEIGSVAYDIQQTVDVLTHLDALHAKARYALDYGGIKPRIVEENECELRNVFHPILAYNNGRTKVVPLSLRFDEMQRGHLISGPNAGGKSVALKSIGLNIAMALSGIFPLGDCLTNPRHILVAIGDHQSIDANLSTFSSQILRLREILAFCAKDSLVLVDEICSGTDPTEGSALAAGILDSFIERRAFFVVTTHQSSLKSYALSHEFIANASLEFDLEQLKPTYAFLEGVPGNSYAFELAKSVQLPELVLQRARAYLGDKHGELEQSIVAIQRYKQDAERLRVEANLKLQAADRKHADYERRFSEFKAKYQKLMSAANHEAAELLQQSKAAIEKALREARESAKPAKEIHAELDNLRSEIAKNIENLRPKDASDQSGTLEIGDHVSMRSSEQSGMIIALEDSKAVVDFNGIHFKIELSELKRSSAPKKKRQGLSAPLPMKLDAAVTADLRGMRAGEAIAKLDAVLSDAVVGNIPFLTVIHGKGTGALRQAVHEFLKEHPSVISYRLGLIGEGDAGVTQVELR